MAGYSLDLQLSGEPEDLDALVGALTPERTDEVPGTESQLTRESPRQATLSIQAEQPAPLRAAVNAYMGWVRTVEDVLAIEPAPSTDKVV